MSTEVMGFSGNILPLKIFGKLRESELKAVQSKAANLIQQHGTVRVLVLVEDFRSSEKKSDCDDLWFQAENDQHIAKLAMVAEKSGRSCRSRSQPRVCDRSELNTLRPTRERWRVPCSRASAVAS